LNDDTRSTAPVKRGTEGQEQEANHSRFVENAITPKATYFKTSTRKGDKNERRGKEAHRSPSQMETVIGGGESSAGGVKRLEPRVPNTGKTADKGAALKGQKKRSAKNQSRCLRVTRGEGLRESEEALRGCRMNRLTLSLEQTAKDAPRA